MALRYKRYKRAFEQSYTFGAFATIELLRHRAGFAEAVLVTSEALQRRGEGVRAVCDLADAHGVPVFEGTRQVEALATREACEVVGVFRKWTPEMRSGASHLVLHEPDTMGNVGTILRTALGFGIDQVAVIQPAPDVFDPRTVRASMGAIFRAGLGIFATFAEYAAAYPDCARFALAITPGAADLREVTISEPFALVLGNEGAGLPADVVAACRPVRIHHTASIDSLNIATAAAIACYEATRRRRFV